MTAVTGFEEIDRQREGVYGRALRRVDKLVQRLGGEPADGKYQLSIAKLPLAKDFDDFQFDGTPVNETLMRLEAETATPAARKRVRSSHPT